MHQFITTCFLSLVLLFSTLTLANEQAGNLEIIQSKVLNEQRKISIKLPDNYFDNLDKKYPVIYILGDVGDLSILTGTLNQIQGQNGAPQTIVALIENTDRTRDLTPTVNLDPRGPVGQGGGGDKYLDFIENELIPHMDKTYRTHHFKTVVGSSIGGLLVIHSLQSRPHLFQAHIAFSPAVWWGDRTTVKKTKEFISKTPTLNNYLYMNIGEEGGDMRAVYDDFHAFLQNNKPANFTLETNAFNSVPHALTSAAGMFNAFHKLFMPMQMPMSAFTGDPESIDNYYQALSSQWGTIIMPSEGNVRQIAYNLINQQNNEAAIRVFKHNIKLHPNSADAQYGLAYGHEVNGDLKAALAQANKALEVLEKSHPYFDFFVRAQHELNLKVTALAN